MNGLGSASISVWVKADVIGTNRGIIYTKDPDGSDSPFSLRYDVSGIAGG
ncbi:MAG: hypothetical protein H6767_08495 [Candidatus Peribacteria bacterium]|nr:MAG: hypothetical protein H6767_08495 [Candidatus Peribacteria bacterium]